MEPLSALLELATSVAVHACAAQVIELKSPPVPHVATNVAVPAYPVAQVTVVFEPVVPLMESLTSLSEFGT